MISAEKKLSAAELADTFTTTEIVSLGCNISVIHTLA